jgi:hypothetical protein
LVLYPDGEHPVTRLKVLLAAASVGAALALSGPDSSAAPSPAGAPLASAEAGGHAVPAMATGALAPGYDWQRYGVYDARRGTWHLISRGTPTLSPQGEGC